jgi:hypothetical protein
MTRAIHGIRKWGPLTKDDEGWREYKLLMLLRTTDRLDGPYQMLRTPGTPTVGSAWSFGNDNDIWAYCRNNAVIDKWGGGDDTAVEADGQDWIYWSAEYTFSNKPLPASMQRCDYNEIQNPILEPYKYSGGFNKYTEEAWFDMYGQPLISSSWELLRGQAVEFDKSRPTVSIEQNVLNLQLALMSAFTDCVNDRPMWGLPARTIKLSNATWEKIYYGTCFYYFKRRLEFEIDFNTWDRNVLDDGTMVLNGRWNKSTRHWEVRPVGGLPPDRFNPAHFIKFTDFNGQPARLLLNGAGLPAGVCIDNYVAQVYEDAFEIYIAILPSGILNVGKSLRDREWWVKWQPATGETAFALPPNDWTSTITYKPGNTVNYNGTYYVALSTHTNNFPHLDNPLWRRLGFGLNASGTYNKATSYVTGDYVYEYDPATAGTGTGTDDPCNSTSVGSIFIQKYPSANFLLLGVPLILPV